MLCADKIIKKRTRHVTNTGSGIDTGFDNIAKDKYECVLFFTSLGQLLSLFPNLDQKPPKGEGIPILILSAPFPVPQPVPVGPEGPEGPVGGR